MVGLVRTISFLKRSFNGGVSIEQMNFFKGPEISKELKNYTEKCNERIKQLPFFADKDDRLIETMRQYVFDNQFKTTRNGLCKNVSKKYDIPQKQADKFVSLCVDKKINGVPGYVSGTIYR